jgi:plasmid maintenance system antidote protein VapI
MLSLEYQKNRVIMNNMKPSEQLRKIIRDWPEAPARVAAATGVSKGVISHFLGERRSITLDTLDQLAPVLGLQIITTKKPPKNKGR